MKKKLFFTFSIIFVILSMQVATIVFASAGGSSGGGGGGSSGGGGGGVSSSGSSYSTSSGTRRGRSSGSNGIGLIVFLGLMVYSRYKNNINDALDKRREIGRAKSVIRFDKYYIEKILLQGNVNSKEEFEKRVEVVYFNIQEAWTERNISLASQDISGRLFWKYTKRIDEMIDICEVNKLEDIRFTSATIKKVYDDGSLIVRVRGRLIDYWVDELKNTIKKGSTRMPRHLRENWKFVVQDGKWVLDDIF